MYADDEEEESQKGLLTANALDRGEVDISDKQIQSIKKLEKINNEHLAAIEETLEIFKRFRLCTLGFAFDYLIRTNIFVLYAKTMDDCPTENTNMIIGIIVYLSYFNSGVISLLCGYLGDKWCFDQLLCLAAIFDVVTFWIEATSTSFITLSVAYIVGGQPMQSIGTGFIAKMLPLYYSKQMMSSFLQIYVIGGILGPIAGGVISYYASYRAVFYVSAVIASLGSIYVFLYIRGTEKTLLQQQLKFQQYYIEFDSYYGLNKGSGSGNGNGGSRSFDSDSDGIDGGIDHSEMGIDSNGGKESGSSSSSKVITKHLYRLIKDNEKSKWIVSDDFRFPVCRNRSLSVNKTKTGNDINNGNGNNISHKASVELTNYNIFLLTVSTLVISLSLCGETAFLTWFTVYIEDKYDGTILLSTGLMSFSAVTFIMGVGFVKFIVRKYQHLRDHSPGSSSGNASSEYASSTNNSDVDEETIHMVGNNNFNNNNNGSNIVRRSRIHNKIFQYDIFNIAVLCMVAGATVRLLMTFFIAPFNLFGFGYEGSYVYTYWFYMFLTSFPLPLVTLSANNMSLDILPNEYSGRIQGAKVCIFFVIKALGALVVGCLYDISYNWFWFSIGMFTAATLTLLIILVVCETCKKQQNRILAIKAQNKE